MSFRVHARRVRDQGLPLGRRVSALRSCVQAHQPFGFHGTLAYLELSAGPFHDDEHALLRALTALEELRERWLAEVAAYAATRRAGKRAGRRTPDPRVPNPHARSRRDDRTGARYRLRLWAGQPAGLPEDPLESELRRCVLGCLERGFGGAERMRLDTCLAAVERRAARSASRDEYRRFHTLLAVADLVRAAASRS